MARAVVVGHGGFSTSDALVLIPPNTTITFLADAGSPLAIPRVQTGPKGDGWVEGQNCHFDYERVASVLDSFLVAEKPLVAKKVVPNMSTDKMVGRPG